MSVVATRQVRVFIAERQTLFSKALSSVFSRDPDIAVAGESQAFDPALALAAGADVIVLDVDFDRDALSALVERRAGDELPVLALAHEPGAGVIQRLFAAGVRGIVQKDIDPADLVRAVKAVARGERYLEPRLGAVLVGAPSSDELSPRETEVLRLVGIGMSNKEIGVRLGVSEKTVKAHASNIFSKLNLAGRTQAALHAQRLGLV